MLQSQLIPIGPRNLKPVLSTIKSSVPLPSPNLSTSRPVMASPLRPSPIPQPRHCPMVTSQKLLPGASSRGRREESSPFPFPESQVFHRREQWPVCVTQEDLNILNECKDSVTRLLRGADINGRVIMYASDRMIPGTASEEIPAKFVWYEDELINYFQRPFDDLGGYS
ncbi:hypothetical protein O181_056258 [Austropuccinia psidii MF-1]|uniref:Uncharacterized protein n=1 Tax=Austropuccinia psidii MF-1 TaxID=1389203 RepID=A0A9Q3E994_9BASI|nr:hypothetical protein [Austropuccinia psidii MF-1]